VSLPRWARPQGAPLVVVDGAGRRVWRDLQGHLAPDPADLVSTNDAWVLAAAVRDAAADGVRAFVCCGGDRAWLAVAAGLSSFADDGAYLVCHGGGPASLPRSFGLTSDAESCALRITGGTDVALDTIRVEPRDGEATEVANAVWAGFGRWAGFLAGTAGRWRSALAVAGLYPFRDYVDLRFGDLERTYEASGLLVANGQYLGDADIAPKAHPADGKADVLVFCGPALDLWRMGGRLRSGTHLPHPRVREFHPVRFEITTKGTRLWADGVDVGTTPAALAIRRGRLRLAI